MAYKAPSNIPANPESIARILQEELRKLELSDRRITALELLLEPLHVEPERPRDGLVVVADGTDWDPGSGGGMYRYDTAWNFIG